MKKIYQFIKKILLIVNHYGEKVEKDIKYKEQKKTLRSKALKEKQ